MATDGWFDLVWFEWLNTLKVYNKKTLEKAVYDRDKSTPLITVSNHYSCLDEPLIWVMLKLSVFGNPTKTRWAIGAHDVVFTNYWNSLYFTLGKTVPVIRGDGVYQETIDFIIERLNLGEWTHVFVEGKVNVDRERLRLKWGVGRMIAECKTSPIVLPIWHCGLDDVLPNVRPYRLHISQKVTYLVGDPMDFTEDVVKLKSLNKSSREIRKHITDKIQEVLFSLREQAEVLHDQHTGKS
ncbi:hypothetical protein LOTGIDRAFT_218317 [Lottia gigantea]|uniref:Tafazzin family protein n=1 Tax=Lottia gigantea TaxID=225164 RepID=V3ZFF4_LOTGI|nr:hypothetical protein LOTGIDRAFT_218317 [Lottia gigantea]ESO89858.1 hypothetical protein LOTGIDRAFT_218317 [Lottia gigantea]